MPAFMQVDFDLAQSWKHFCFLCQKLEKLPKYAIRITLWALLLLG